MNVLQLTKKLIKIPSFVDKKNNEKELGEFICNYLEKFSYLQVEKQKIEGDRFNIIAKDSYPPKLLFACHMDTVEPKIGWASDQLSGIVKNNRLYGLGSCDMKGGTACTLDALQEFNDTRGLMLLFYCDEEYDFKGMRKFLRKYSFEPELAVFPESTEQKIINGCRGVIEIYFQVSGKTGHAARPQEGRSAIDGAVEAINSLRWEIRRYENSSLGKPTLNLAYLSGGLMKGVDGNSKIILGDRGNNISDVAEVVLDIRTTSSKLNGKKVVDFLEKNIKKNGLQLKKTLIRSDFGPMYVPKTKIKSFEDAIKEQLGRVDYGDITKQGYFDGEMMYKKLGIPCVYFGPKGGNAHGANEWVDIRSLKEVREVYKDLIRRVCL